VPPAIAGTSFEGWTPDWRLITLPGVEQVRWGGAARLDPVGTLLGISAPEVEPGRVRFEMPWTDWLTQEDGRPQPGMLAALADAAHSAAVHSSLPAMRVLTTSSLTLSFVAGQWGRVERVACRADVATAPGEEGTPLLSSASIEDDSGRLLALSSARCVVQALPGGTPDDRPDPSPEPGLEHPADAPFRRSPAGSPPIYHLIGLRAAKRGEGEATYELLASSWLAHFTGNVQGGILTALAEAACSSAAATTLEPGREHLPLDLRVDFLRPAAADGSTITARAVVVRRGQRVAFTTCDLLTTEGERVAIATASISI
jgi:uncharacterized protein (TIGR00369 family)